MYSYSKKVKQVKHSTHWLITVLKYSHIHVTSSLISAHSYFQESFMALSLPFGFFPIINLSFLSMKCRLPLQLRLFPFSFFFFFFFFFFFGFLEPHPWHMEVPRLGVKSELHHSHSNKGSKLHL